MGYVILQLALTIDNYIARLDGSVDFLDPIDDSFNNQFKNFIDSIDSMIMGRNTYEVMLKFGDIPFKNKKIFVLTHDVNRYTHPDIIFTDINIKKLVDQLDGNIWLFGGANLITHFMDENLVDELQLYTVPKTTGSGISLFNKHDQNNEWTLISHERFSDNLYTIYRKNK
ncbi:MAG: dihydrofolate reductase family protein [Acholeplasmataceae bacterium]|nr:dihydrofolate reductase family protein [Acholeplasmataceae bacterium]